MAEDHAAHRARHVLELLLPALRVRVGHRLLADHAVEDQVEQAVLGADVPVQRRGGGVQRPRDVAHAEQVEAVGVEHGERGVDDRLLRQRLAPAARRRCGARAQGGAGRVGHLNSVKEMNALLSSGRG